MKAHEATAAVQAPECFFLQTLFKKLNESLIRYAVLRNYETLPFSTGGSDLDILVHPIDEKRVREVIAETILMAGGVSIGCSNTVGFFKIYTFGRGKSETDKWWGLRLDMSIGLRYAGVADLLDNDILTKRYRLHNGIRVLPKNLAAVLGVVKELLHNDILPPRYLVVAADAATKDWDELHADLLPMGEPALAILRNLCTVIPDSKALVTKSCAFRNAILRTAFLRSPLAYFRFRFLFEWSKVRRFANPSGKVVALLGTDGVGKTTVISAIEPTLSAATHGAITIKHLRPGLLPPLANLKARQPVQEGPVTNPHGATPSGRIGSSLRVLYLITDYVLGYWLIVRPRIAKSPAIILFDRYAYDLVLDPSRFRINLSHRVISRLVKFVPKPRCIICLHGDPALIAMRKSELPLVEVRRQTKALRDYAEREPRAVLISTEGSLQQTRDDVLVALKEAFISSSC